MWRLPTKNEWQELEEMCTWVWTFYNGVNGYKVTGRNGNYIFLQAAGFCNDGIYEKKNVVGAYWSASLNTVDPYVAWDYSFDSNNHFMDVSNRCYKQSVRPVSDNHDIGIDLGLSVNWCEHNWRDSADTDYSTGDYYTYDEAIQLFENQNNNKMENEPILELNGKRYKTKAGGPCGDACALYKICDDKSPISDICAAFATTSESNFELMSDHVTDSSKMVENNRLRPDYYVINGIEVKDLLGEMSFNIGNAMKYLVRHGRKTEQGIDDKTKAIEDLRKAKEYIEFEIERLSK